MVLQFKTPRNKCGNRRYIAIDTAAGTFTRHNPHFIIEAIELKNRDFSQLVKELENGGFIEKEEV